MARLTSVKVCPRLRRLRCPSRRRLLSQPPPVRFCVVPRLRLVAILGCSRVVSGGGCVVINGARGHVLECDRDRKKKHLRARTQSGGECRGLPTGTSRPPRPGTCRPGPVKITPMYSGTLRPRSRRSSGRPRPGHDHRYANRWARTAAAMLYVASPTGPQWPGRTTPGHCPTSPPASPLRMRSTPSASRARSCDSPAVRSRAMRTPSDSRGGSRQLRGLTLEHARNA